MKRKKVLLLSYHSLPMDVISSYRTKAYLDYLPKNGYDVTLITHLWKREVGQPWEFHDEMSSEIIEDLNQNVRVIRLPRKKNAKGRWLEIFHKVPVFSKIYVLISWLLGYLDASPELYDSYCVFKSYLWNHLKENKYDLSLSIFSPHFHHKLAYEINKEFDIPYVLDFRDLWSNRIVHKNYSPSIVEKLQDVSVKYFWKRWLGQAMFFSITSEEWKNKINSFSSTKGVVVYNGFDSEVKEGKKIGDLKSKFNIVHTGSLYHNQDLTLFLEAYCSFLKTVKNPQSIHLYLIGAKRIEAKTLISKIDPSEMLASMLPRHSYTITERMPRNEAVNFLASANLLWMPSFPDSPGTISGKFFEYLGIEKPIIVTPSGNEDIDSILNETKLGESLSINKEIVAYLSSLYSNQYAFKKNKEAILRYSRESQVKVMVDNINLE